MKILDIRPESNFDQLLYMLVAIQEFDRDRGISDDAIICEMQEFARAGLLAVAKNLRVYRDGNQWCCTGVEFINLQESPAAFADSPKEAIDAFFPQASLST